MVRGLTATASANSLVARFDELPNDAIAIAGGKGASLSRMTIAGLPVPAGFIVCTASFDSFLEAGEELVSLDASDPRALEVAAELLQSRVRSQPIPYAVDRAIREAYLALGTDVLVAVRSSAVSEDGESASFAGQHETFLNVQGPDAVIDRVRECWASLFSTRAMFYRARQGMLNETRMAVVVQAMALGEISGVLFTADPVQNRRDRMVIEAVRGLGEALVSGTVTPDHYVVDRDDGSLVQEFVSSEDGTRILGAGQLRDLLQMGLRLEQFFGRPQDVEWCIRAEEILLLQSRPITAMGGPGAS